MEELDWENKRNQHCILLDYGNLHVCGMFDIDIGPIGHISRYGRYFFKLIIIQGQIISDQISDLIFIALQKLF